jgi:hypothetical protein
MNQATAIFPNLAPHHLAMLRDESGLSDEVIAARGCHTVYDAEDLIASGFTPAQCRVPGLIIPLHAPNGTQPYSVYRPDHPRVVEHKDKKPLPDGSFPCTVLKYEVPKGQPMRLDAPPPCQASLGNPAVPLNVTEGQKKADALASRGLCAIAVLGVWNWMGKNRNGGNTVLADWRDVALKDRDVRIVFDSDAAEKEQVMHALRDLADVLRNRGAVVTTVVLPPSPEGGKQGVDDYLAAGHTVADLESLVSTQKVVATAFTNRKTRERPKSADYINALAKLGYTFRMNECNDAVEVNGESLSDALRAKVRTEMRDEGFEYVHVMEDVCTTSAYQNRYHPIREYLNNLVWDGEDHIERLAVGYLFDQHPTIEYSNGLARSVTYVWLLRWLIGAVAKVLDGEQNMMLVFDGRQDIGKSYLARWLGSPMPSYFVEGPLNPDDKDTALRLISTWIWEVAELGSTTRRADREALKHAITAKEWTVRPPYGRSDIKKPALASMIGTINNEAGFLNDPTGNRRFLVATLQEIDWGYTAIDVNQIWAQAVAMYRNGEPVRLLPVEKAMQRQLNGGYELDDPMEDWLQQHFDLTGDSNDFLPTAAIVDLLQSRGMRGTTKALSMQFSATALRLGLEKGRRDGQRGPRGYFGIRVSSILAPTSEHQVGANNGHEREIVF